MPINRICNHEYPTNSLQIPPPFGHFFKFRRGGGFVENFHQIENNLRPINEIFKSSVFFFCSCSKNLQNRPKFSRKIDDVWQEIQNSSQISNIFLTNMMINIGNSILYIPIKILACPIFYLFWTLNLAIYLIEKSSGFEGGGFVVNSSDFSSGGLVSLWVHERRFSN